MDLEKLLEQYDAGNLTSREVAQRLLSLITEENSSEIFALIRCNFLREALWHLVDDWKDLTDEQWSGMKMLRSYNFRGGPDLDARIKAQEDQNKVDNQLMRRGVNFLARIKHDS